MELQFRLPGEWPVGQHRHAAPVPAGDDLERKPRGLFIAFLWADEKAVARVIYWKVEATLFGPRTREN